MGDQEPGAAPVEKQRKRYPGVARGRKAIERRLASRTQVQRALKAAVEAH
eukprot:SAG11_NODE_7426_length_1146_cov_0.951289_1_plen_49_part_10